MKKYLFIALCIFSFQTLLAQDVQLYFQNKTVKNANTALLFLKSNKKLIDPKLTIDNMNIDFISQFQQEGLYFAFVPVGYYQKTGQHRVIVSYILNNQRQFKGIDLNVENGDYKSETISVASSKVTLNTQSKKRTKKEYQEAMSIYNHVSKNTLESLSFIYPMKSKITSAFGTKRVYNGSLKSYHSGTDFKAKIGEPIKAASSGVVKIAKNRFYAGNSVVIDHGYGVYTGYYHLSQINVKLNQKVKQGEVIGLSGSTGRVTGPHLHFSLRIHGIQVDPLQFIKVSQTL